MDPRLFWEPAFAHHFGIQPWRMDDVSTAEYVACHQYLKSMAGD